MQAAVPPLAQGLARHVDVGIGGDLGRVDVLYGLPGHADLRLRLRPRPVPGRSLAFLWTSLSRGLARYPALRPAATMADRHLCSARLFRRRRGIDDLLHVTGPDVLAGNRGDDRGGEPLAQPPQGVSMLAGAPLHQRRPVGVQGLSSGLGYGCWRRVACLGSEPDLKVLP
jgi:hypothetical protein